MYIIGMYVDVDTGDVISWWSHGGVGMYICTQVA